MIGLEDEKQSRIAGTMKHGDPAEEKPQFT